MCWCLRVYWTVLHNLFVRFFENVGNSIYNNDHCCCSFCCCCKCSDCQQQRQQMKLVSEFELSPSEREESNIQHDYVIVDDIDANYLEIERRKIETESYYRTVDRTTAEDMLTCREDGSCLVRPYKEMDISIKYIASVYAQQQYFHLFIRQISGKELYAIGQQKANEKLFHTPSDIIEFYSYNPLQCTNKNISISLILKPIIA